jgi:sugar/nucleoside kinase (ribokinase family)
VAAVRFIAVGDVLVDVLAREVPGREERIHAPITLRAGGSAANAAVWAAALGATATVVGRVGSDPAGDLVAGVLAGRGIEASLARDPQVPTGVAIALGVGSSVASPGASGRLAPEDVADPCPGDALLVSGFSLLQASSAPGARAALERFAGRWAAVDLASPGLAAGAAENLEETSTGANVLLATADEARAVTGMDPEDAARALAARFDVACVKLGAHGAVAVQGSRVVRSSGDPVVRRSPFGAGDAFAAALLVTLAAGDSLDGALDLACETGARSAASEDGWPARVTPS